MPARRAAWPEVDLKPSAVLVRHLRMVHGLVVTDESRVECDEAEGWMSQADHHASCDTMLVNGGSGKVRPRATLRSN